MNTVAPLLTVDRISKSFWRRRVLDDVNLEIGVGEVVGLLGPNGAGKTTTFRIVAGLLRPDAGTVRFDGRDVTRLPLYRRANECRIGYLAQEPAVFRQLTVAENLTGFMSLLGLDKEDQKRRTDELLSEFGLNDFRDRAAETLSGGQRRRLEVARSLITSPRLLLMDEPFAGIDPLAVEGVRQLIVDLRRRGISILITDHQVSQLLSAVDRCYVIHHGKVLVDGNAATVLDSAEARRVYFGANAPKAAA